MLSGFGFSRDKHEALVYKKTLEIGEFAFRLAEGLIILGFFSYLGKNESSQIFSLTSSAMNTIFAGVVTNWCFSIEINHASNPKLGKIANILCQSFLALTFNYIAWVLVPKAVDVISKHDAIETCKK